MLKPAEQFSGRILDYRHSKHAGNHGDVLKHFVFVQLLKLSLSTADLVLIDTHAGAGKYILSTDQECQHGILRLLAARDSPRALQEYLALVQAFDSQAPDESFVVYPGSPLLAHHVKSDQYSIKKHFLFEWNPSQLELLQRSINKEFRGAEFVELKCSDGFEGAIHTIKTSIKLDKPDRRQNIVVLIDPPFKDISFECDRVYSTVQSLLSTTTGSHCAIMVWIPMLQDNDSNRILEQLLQNLETLCEQQDGNHTNNVDTKRFTWNSAAIQLSKQGLLGSVIWIANPPGGLKNIVEPNLSWLSECLRQECSISRWKSN